MTHETPCKRHPELFLEPGEDDQWEASPQAEAARNHCATCPAIAACAASGLTTPDGKPHVADGVILAGHVCRGDRDTLNALRNTAGDLAPHLGITPILIHRRRTDTAGGDCPGCHRPMLPKRAAPQPGHVHRAARGLCRGCSYRATAGAAPRFKPPKNCLGCSEPMVNKRSPGAKHGQAVRHQAKGLCIGCYAAARRDQAAAA